MFYVKRDADNNIISVSKEPDNDTIEFLEADDPEILTFFESKKVQEEYYPIDELQASDLQMIRAVEDLIEVLIRKNIINFTDLPSATQTKILQRKKVREKLGDIM